MQNAQVHLFVFLAAVAVGTVVGGPLGDRFGRKYVIWFSILGVLPFTLMLPYANLFWTGVADGRSIGLILASAFSAIVVYAQELMPGKVGMISGLFFGFSFGMGGLGAAVLGWLADATGIETVYQRLRLPAGDRPADRASCRTGAQDAGRSLIVSGEAWDDLDGNLAAAAPF